jgi:hypothetical protein
VWLDPQLTWKDHISKSAAKGESAFNAMTRLTASTWGPSVRKSKLLYTAVARPAMTYGAPVWAAGTDGCLIPTARFKALQVLQNKCLRRTLGAYRRTPTAALEKESGTPPIDLYITALVLQRAVKTEGHPVTQAIRAKLHEVWTDATRAEPRRRRGRPRKQTAQPNTNIDKARERGKEIVDRRVSDRANPTPDKRGGRIQVRGQIKEIGDELQEEWKRRWESQAAKPHRHAPTWKEGWSSQPTWIYDGVRKHVATAIFLLRSEVLGLRAWLSGIGVPGITPECSCGHPRQTIQHVLGFCPDQVEARIKLLERTGHTQMDRLLRERDTARWAGQWLLDTGLLEYLQLALKVEATDTGDWAPFTNA